MKRIASRDNPAVKSVARLLASASERRKTGLSVLDGTHLLAAFLDTGAMPEQVLVGASAQEGAEIAALLARVPGRCVAIVDDALMEGLSTVETPTGILAVVRTPAGTSVPADADFALALEDIQDPGNVGTLLRSAAAAGAGHVLLSPQCAFAWSPKVLRAGMGAHFRLNIQEKVDLAAWIGSYRGQAIALDGRAERPLFALDCRRPLTLLVGNEGAGLSPALRAAAAVGACIPMPGRIESLNAAAAGAIALFEVVRQRAAAPRTP